MDYFDPDGDVTLEVGQELKAHYSVSSKVLGLASPVFKAMFSPQFREGSELAAGIRKPIPLPDDDPDSMAIICGILHHKTDGIPAHPSLETIGDVAVLCDKYKMCEATRGWTQAWLSKYSHIFNSPEFRPDMLTVLWITSALDDAENFTSISRAFIVSYRNNAKLEKDSPGFDLLHNSVIPKLIETAKEIKEETLAKFSRALGPVFSYISWTSLPEKLTECAYHRRAVDSPSSEPINSEEQP
ncbi:MAG: hypothetical protein M1824_005177 [Vezdaea acicularis]|nr:MAG: hypothetical protein M1824_005177 [Vezdaea acicularis]